MTSVSSKATTTTTTVSIANTKSFLSNNSYNQDSRFGCNICLESVVEPVVTLCGHLYCWPCLFRWLEPGMTTEECRLLFQGQDGLDSHQRRRLTSTSVGATVADSMRRNCPVCKASCSVSTVVPIYVRGTHETHHCSTTSGGGEHGQQQQQQHSTLMESRSAMSSTEHKSNSNEHNCELTSSTSNRSMEATAGLVHRRLRFQQIPARPLLLSPSQQPPAAIIAHTLLQHSPPPPLSTGFAMSLQQAVFGTIMVPPLHHYLNSQQQSQHQDLLQQEPAATEYLSRVLLMLGSFVILCLLLF